MKNQIIKANRTNGIPLIITPEVKEQIKNFKSRLMDMRDHPEETSDFDVRTIDIILNELSDYDRNFIIAYYELAESSATKLGRLFNISQPLVVYKIKAILKKIKNLNDTPKTDNNKPRTYLND